MPLRLTAGWGAPTIGTPPQTDSLTEMKSFPTVNPRRCGSPFPNVLPRRSPMNRRSAARRPPRTHAPLLAVIETLEPRAMLAGLGPESWSAAGLAPAPLGTGALLSSGIILTCSSPAPGSAGTASSPAPTAGSGGVLNGGDLWLSCSAGSGAGTATFGSTSGMSKHGPALSSQSTGGSGAGQGSGATTGSGGALSGSDLCLPYIAGSGASTTTSGSAGGVKKDGPALSSQYTGGSGAGQGRGTTIGPGGTLSGGELWISYIAGSGAGISTSGSTGGVSKDGPALSSQVTGGSGAGQGSGTATGSGGLPFVLFDASQTAPSGTRSQTGTTGATAIPLADGQSSATITPLVYLPGSDDGPGLVSGVWTGNGSDVQFVPVADPGSQSADTIPNERPSWDDVKDWFPGTQWQFEVESSLWDPPTEELKPKDEFDSIPTDENGNYAWLNLQAWKQFLAELRKTGKEFALHMAQWSGDRIIGVAAQGGVRLVDAAGASLPLWFVTRCGKSIKGGSVALGLSDRLDDFASTFGAQTWKQLVPDSPEMWRRKFLGLLNDGNTRFTFNLDGVDVWRGLARAAKGSGGMTDWELLQLKMAKDSWGRITWIKDGVVVVCPFE